MGYRRCKRWRKLMALVIMGYALVVFYASVKVTYLHSHVTDRMEIAHTGTDVVRRDAVARRFLPVPTAIHSPVPTAHIDSSHSPTPVQCNNRETLELRSNFDDVHVYHDYVHIRFIVLTYDRAGSLEKVLNSLQGMYLDGHNASVEIWLDRSKRGRVDCETLDVARNFCWDRGPTHVHVHGSHVGIYGQWINTWSKPKQVFVNSDRTENRTLTRMLETLVVILEDDTDVSRFAYRWLRSAHVMYGGLSNLIGYSLQNENVKVAKGRRQWREVNKRSKDVVYGYKVPGSWGFSPHPDRWGEFQQWYAEKYSNKSFHPYVNDASMHTRWYKHFEKRHTADNMWTMWIIRFCWERNLFTIYTNIPQLRRNVGSLVANRKEVGLHYAVKGQAPRLMERWWRGALHFPATLKLYDYDDRYIASVKIKPS